MNQRIEREKEIIRGLIQECKAEIEDLESQLRDLEAAEHCNHQWVEDVEFKTNYPKAVDTHYCKICNIGRYEYNNG